MKLLFLLMFSFLPTCAVRWPMNVWLVNHRLVFWAQCCAAADLGNQLVLHQMSPIQWLGLLGMLWDKLLPTLAEELKSRCQQVSAEGLGYSCCCVQPCSCGVNICPDTFGVGPTTLGSLGLARHEDNKQADKIVG